MARRKTFHVETPRIVPADQGNHGWLWLLAALALAAWTWFVYQYALNSRPQLSAAPVANEAGLLARIDELEEERDRLLAQRPPAESSAAPDPVAVEEPLVEEVVIEEVVAPAPRTQTPPQPEVTSPPPETPTPSLAAANLEVQDFSLKKVGDGYAYTFVLARPKKGEDKVEGRLVLRVPDQGSGSTDNSSPGAIGEAHKLGFRHFQSLEGRLSLPDGTMPSELRMELALTAPEAGNFIHTVPWSTTGP